MPWNSPTADHAQLSYLTETNFLLADGDNDDRWQEVEIPVPWGIVAGTFQLKQV